MCTVRMQIMVCEMINSLLEIWLEIRLKFILKYNYSMQLIAQS